MFCMAASCSSVAAETCSVAAALPSATLAISSVWGIFEGETYPFLRTGAPLHRLSVAVEGKGTVAVSPSGAFLAEGTEVTLTARPAAGSRFVRWTGDVPSGGVGRNPLKITILKDTSLRVRFEAGAHPAVWMIH